MDCRAVRDRLTRQSSGPSDAAHLEGCPECAGFARRLALAREVLSPPGAVAEPDPGFAGRVIERLPQPTEVLGWAALRALPAALLLALALAWVGALEPTPPTLLLTLEASPDALLTWSVLTEETER